MTPFDMLLGAVGAKDGPCSGGRQMPSHWSSKKLHIVSQSSPTGTQILHAVGAAEASLYFSLVREAAELATSFQDRKSTRLNSSHVRISYAVFCLKKKKQKDTCQWDT